MKRKWQSRKQLEDLGLSLEVNVNGEYEFYRLDGYTKKKMRTYEIVTKHDVGKTLSYPALSIYHGKVGVKSNGKAKYKQSFILAHVFVWLWFNHFIQDGMDIDHIDNDTHNYKIENLQELTRKDNLNKGGVGRNQYTARLSTEEILARREKKIAENVAKRIKREEDRKAKWIRKETRNSNLKTFKKLFSKYSIYDNLTEDERVTLIELLKSM